MSSERLPRAFALLLVATACGGQARVDDDAIDTAADVFSEATPDAPDEASDGGAERSMAETSDGDAGRSIVWSDSPPSVVGDGRLVDVGDAIAGLGWDRCDAFPPMSVVDPGTTPSPAPTRGNRYLLSSASPAADARQAEHIAQAYFWPDQAATAEGLWFDLVLVSGSAAGATVSLYETDRVCRDKRAFGTFGLESALSTNGQWKTGCLDLSGKGDLEAIGIRIDAYAGVIGFDALRFGKACE